MAEQFDLVIQSGSLVMLGGIAEGDVGVRDEQSRGFGAPGSLSGGEVIDAKGLHVLPGVASKAGWTPYAGFKPSAKPVATIIRGNSVMRDGALQGDPLGQPMKFHDTMLAGA